jgi:curved DNA-binding protein CbpA
MTDCYRILGVSRHAAPGEIRAAYLAKIKLCHPDAPGGGNPDEAGEISHAYWCLRDADRRAGHDQALFGPVRLAKSRNSKVPRAPVSLRKQPRRPPPARATPPVGSRSTRHRPQARRLQPVRAAAGVAACALAIVGFAAAGTHFGSQAAPQARSEGADAAYYAPVLARRRIDPDLSAAAAGEFREVVARSGVAGAHLYARQCLLELAARPSMTMLDYCIAFDDEASSWENASQVRRSSRRYFAPDQRFGRYRSAAQDMSPGRVRESMNAEIGFFAAARD